MNKLQTGSGITKIRTKLILSQIFIALIPFVLLGIVGVLFSIREARKNVTQRTSQTVIQVSQTLDTYMEDLDKLVLTVSDEIAAADLGDDWDQEAMIVSRSMQNIMGRYDEIAGMLYADSNDRYISTGITRISRDSFQKENWYKVALSDPDKSHKISTVTGRNITTDVGYSVDDVFSIVKAVKDKETGEARGVLLMDIGHSIISSAIRESQQGGEGFVFVLDEEDHMVYTPINQVVYRIRPEWLTDEDETMTVDIDGGRYLIRYKESEKTGWKTVSVTSYDELMGDYNRMIGVFAVILVATLLLVQYLSIRVSDNITRPIKHLRNLMMQTEEGNLSLRFESNSRDEIADLGMSFNHMIVKIRELLDRVRHEEDLKRKAELKIVQEQFKPHFLYNTLDTINWMAREHGAKDIVSLVDALTNVFRISLSHGKDYITIREEINYISSYLYVQKTRYEDKLLFEIDADEDCMQRQVPKLILQPLVENAIYHGIKLKRGTGHINISVHRIDDRICMSVEDDGKGMDENTRDSLRDLLKTGERTDDVKVDDNQSFGLFYVKERLQQRYRDNYSVEVESTQDIGTRISIYIPFFEEETGVI
ncbi:cache domain-containing sensor histidine kinase [Butyrivibrio sp. NC2007]|uniref:cache domain-containing sensor histidine kinase n=1 Tax=Butyrivibrio sp. NC2007 TaxID=1280683 RepID=UPI0003B66D13|nr:sensor histidine kinase [Butyrivibrio sp. NC2007]